MRYEIGALVRLTGTFTDPNNDDAAIDPTNVLLDVKEPGKDVTSYTYGVGGTIVKDSTGAYHADISVSTAGRWWYRWYSTGTAQTADEESFIVHTQQTA